MSKMDSFLNFSSLNTTVSRKVILFSDISAVNLMVRWNLLALWLRSCIQGGKGNCTKQDPTAILHIDGKQCFCDSDK